MSNSGEVQSGKNLSGNDELLHPFLNCSSDPQAQTILEQLVTVHAEPIIQRAMRRKMQLSFPGGGADSPEHNVEDICSETRLNLLRSLRQLRDHPDQSPIRNFHNYVASIFFQVWDKQLRMMHPRRWRLKNQIRYLLRHHASFALWNSEMEAPVGGLAAWKGRAADVRSATYQDTLSHPQQFVSPGLRHSARALAELLKSIFNHCRGPMELDDLVSVGARMMGVMEPAGRSADPEALSHIPDSRATVSEQYEQRWYLNKLWSEICSLPLRQRIALLLGLRDSAGRALTPLLPCLGISTIAGIAELLEFSYDEMLEMWNKLPMEDAAISEVLQISRQQVINLRKSARERLARRTNLFSVRGNETPKSTSMKK